MNEKKVLLTVQVLDDGSLLCDSARVSGEQLIEAVALLISGSVGMVEQTWLSAGSSAESAQQAGQCAINRAAIKLNGGGGRITSGRIETRTGKE